MFLGANMLVSSKRDFLASKCICTVQQSRYCYYFLRKLYLLIEFKLTVLLKPVLSQSQSVMFRQTWVPFEKQ